MLLLTGKTTSLIFNSSRNGKGMPLWPLNTDFSMQFPRPTTVEEFFLILPIAVYEKIHYLCKKETTMNQIIIDKVEYVDG